MDNIWKLQIFFEYFSVSGIHNFTTLFTGDSAHPLGHTSQIVTIEQGLKSIFVLEQVPRTFEINEIILYKNKIIIFRNDVPTEPFPFAQTRLGDGTPLDVNVHFLCQKMDMNYVRVETGKLLKTLENFGPEWSISTVVRPRASFLNETVLRALLDVGSVTYNNSCSDRILSIYVQMNTFKIFSCLSITDSDPDPWYLVAEWTFTDDDISIIVKNTKLNLYQYVYSVEIDNVDIAAVTHYTEQKYTNLQVYAAADEATQFLIKTIDYETEILDGFQVSKNNKIDSIQNWSNAFEITFDVYRLADTISPRNILATWGKSPDKRQIDFSRVVQLRIREYPWKLRKL